MSVNVIFSIRHVTVSMGNVIFMSRLVIHYCDACCLNVPMYLCCLCLVGGRCERVRVSCVVARTCLSVFGMELVSLSFRFCLRSLF